MSDSLDLFLDPDFRKDTPSDGTPYCVRCQKPIRDLTEAVAVTLGDEGLRVIRTGGPDLIGPDCWRVITAPPGAPEGEG